MGSIVRVLDLKIPIPVSVQVWLEIADLLSARQTIPTLHLGPLKVHYERFDRDEATSLAYEKTFGRLGLVQGCAAKKQRRNPDFCLKRLMSAVGYVFKCSESR